MRRPRSMHESTIITKLWTQGWRSKALRCLWSWGPDTTSDNIYLDIPPGSIGRSQDDGIMSRYSRFAHIWKKWKTYLGLIIIVLGT